MKGIIYMKKLRKVILSITLIGTLLIGDNFGFIHNSPYKSILLKTLIFILSFDVHISPPKDTYLLSI